MTLSGTRRLRIGLTQMLITKWLSGGPTLYSKVTLRVLWIGCHNHLGMYHIAKSAELARFVLFQIALVGRFHSKSCVEYKTNGLLVAFQTSGAPRWAYFVCISLMEMNSLLNSMNVCPPYSHIDACNIMAVRANDYSTRLVYATPRQTSA
jgi:hypothetical protein